MSFEPFRDLSTPAPLLFLLPLDRLRTIVVFSELIANLAQAYLPSDEPMLPSTRHAAWLFALSLMPMVDLAAARPPITDTGPAVTPISLGAPTILNPEVLASKADGIVSSTPQCATTVRATGNVEPDAPDILYCAIQEIVLRHLEYLWYDGLEGHTGPSHKNTTLSANGAKELRTEERCSLADLLGAGAEICTDVAEIFTLAASTLDAYNGGDIWPLGFGAAAIGGKTVNSVLAGISIAKCFALAEPGADLGRMLHILDMHG